MKSVFVYPLRLLAFWLLFFAVFRVWFVAWFHREWLPGNPLSAWQSLWYALPLDMSTAGYLMAVPVLLWFAGMATGERSYNGINKVISVLNVCFIGILVLVFGSNIFIYEEWHTLLNNRALEYLSTPRAMMDSMSLPFKVISVGLYVTFIWLMWRIYRLVVGKNIFSENVSRWGVLALPVHTGLLLLVIRGGIGVIPINESAVYYSSHLFNNHAATNAVWNLIHSLIETRSTVNHYRFMDDKEAEDRTRRFIGACAAIDPGRGLIENPENNRPNIVFLIMESHTAGVIEELGGVPGVCPNLSRLIREGVLFEHIYGSGYRTDQGLVSILAGYPAQPDQSIVLQTDKAARLNSLSKILHGQKGYATAFFYGGELTFANIGLWLTNQRFEKIFSEKNFSRAEKTQRWGVDDHKLLQRAIEEIGRMKEPFFATAMTLSLHPPYDVPYQSKWQGQTQREKFLNSAAFADDAIGAFFKVAEQQPWYANTLFVLVADHGSRYPADVGLDNPKSRHIPLIFFGKPLQKTWQGARVPVYGNHHDVPATVLGALGLSNPDLNWSRNLWAIDALADVPADSKHPCSGSAFFTNENGLGWVNGQGKGFYKFGSGEWQIWEGSLDSTIRTDARAYLQSLYSDFLKR